MRLGFIEEKAALQREVAALEECDFAVMVYAKHNADDEMDVEICGVNIFSWQGLGLLEQGKEILREPED